MSAGFALLRAPQLVQTQVLNIFKPQEIFIFSLCSKRAYRLAKVRRTKPERRELLVECAFPRLEISCYDAKYENTIDGMPINILSECPDISKMSNQTEIINIGNIKVPLKLEPYGVFIAFWEDRVHGIKTVIDYVTRLFNMKIDILEINKSSLWLMDWINSRQESLKEVTVHDGKSILTDEEIMNILTNCKATNEMCLYFKAPATFSYTEEFRKPNVMRIDGSPWVTLDNLKSMDSIEIYLDRSNLTSSDMNLFLKHWLAGGSPRLSFASIDVCRIHFDDVFKDLTEEIVHVPEEREFKSLNGVVLSFENTYEIEREDGMKASIELIEYAGRAAFYFVVFPATEIIN